MTTRLFKRATLAVALAALSSTAAMGQEKKEQPNWLQNLTSRITLNGYAQAGWAYQDPNGKKHNA